jgi:serine protease
MIENLYADNETSVTFAYTNKYFLDFGNTSTQLNVSLNKVGSGNLTVTSLSADSATGLGYTDNSSGGFGSYSIVIDRDSMPDGEFSNTIYFNLSNSTSVAVPIYYSVGTLRGRVDVGKLYVSLYNDADEEVAAGTLDMESSGVLGFIASDLPNDEYYLFASTNIDDDGYVCTNGELCQYYPDFSSTSSFFTLNGASRSGFEIAIQPIFKNGGINAASLSNTSSKRDKERKVLSSTNKILQLNTLNLQQSKVLGEKSFIPHSK